MNEQIKQLKGSPKRDLFKWAHKNKINRPFYASDCDLCLVSYEPRGVIAYIDYKNKGDTVTPTEEILYDEWSKTKPVFIVEASDPENGSFTITRYKTRASNEFICKLNDWSDFEKWEESLRKEYKEKTSV